MSETVAALSLCVDGFFKSGQHLARCIAALFDMYPMDNNLDQPSSSKLGRRHPLVGVSARDFGSF
eukprot:3678612-Amphidinium_carterae.1